MKFVVEIQFKNLAAPQAAKPITHRYYDVSAKDTDDLISVMADRVNSDSLEYETGYDGVTRKLREYSGISFATRTDGPSIGQTIN